MLVTDLKKGDLFIVGGDFDKPLLRVTDGYVELRDEVQIPEDDIPDGEVRLMSESAIATHLGMSVSELKKITARYLQETQS